MDAIAFVFTVVQHRKVNSKISDQKNDPNVSTGPPAVASDLKFKLIFSPGRQRKAGNMRGCK